MTDTPIPKHVQEFIAYLYAQPIQLPPLPWHHITTYGIGGLLAVGYGDDCDILLVLSTQGRGLFDCRTGIKIARDYDDAYSSFDAITLLADGFDVLKEHQIPIAGLYGGGLPNSTRDGWRVEAIALPWPHHSIILEQPNRSWYDDKTNATRVGEDGACELRAYGFSPTGESFVIATSCDLQIFARA